jgi:hypothetical protein
VPAISITSGSAMIGSNGTSNGGEVLISGNTILVPLTNVANAQRIQVTLHNVSTTSAAGDVVAPMSFLFGDVNSNGTVNVTDVSATKGFSGQQSSTGNFRSDVNASGGINATDISIVKSLSGTQFPAGSGNAERRETTR